MPRTEGADRRGAAARLTPLRLLAFLVILVLAAISAMAAFANSLGRMAPQAALGTWPPNGEAYARASTQLLVLSKSPQAEAENEDLVEQSAALARRALVLEPTSVAAIRNLGLILAGRGQRENARSLMEAGSEMSRRRSEVNLWLSEDLALRGDEAGALRYFDATIRSSSSAANLLMPALVGALRRPGSAEAFVSILGQNPPWHDAFWTAVLSSEGELGDAYDLRRRLHELKVPMAADHDALLIQRLVSAGRIDEAFNFYAMAAPDQRMAKGELIANSDFQGASRYVPIDWKVDAGPRHAGLIESDDGTLVISALAEASGTVAQQLVRIDNGRYRLVVEYADAMSQAAPLNFRLTCAELGGERTLDRTIAIPATGSWPVNLETPCRHAWVSVELDASRNHDGIDVALDRVSLRGIEG